MHAPYSRKRCRLEKRENKTRKNLATQQTKIRQQGKRTRELCKYSEREQANATTATATAHTNTQQERHLPNDKREPTTNERNDQVNERSTKQNIRSNCQFKTMNNLNVMQINVNSIQSKHKRAEFAQFIEKHKPDVVLISETKLQPKNEILFRGFRIFRNDRIVNNGGGTAVLVKESLACEYVPVPNEIKSFECCIKMKTINEKSLIFASVYKPPSKKENNKTVQIKINADELNEILNIDKNALYIIGGDFNSHHRNWNSEMNCANGESLSEWYQSYNNFYDLC